MAEASEEKVNILIVDDRPDKLLTYEVMLAELNENIVRANSGREALRWLLRKDFAVILLDVNMPGMDGFEVCRRLKTDTRTRLTPIILITGLNATEDRVRGNGDRDHFRHDHQWNNERRTGHCFGGRKRRHHQQRDLARRQRFELNPHHHRQRPHCAHGPIRLERFSLPCLAARGARGVTAAAPGSEGPLAPRPDAPSAGSRGRSRAGPEEAQRRRRARPCDTEREPG